MKFYVIFGKTKGAFTMSRIGKLPIKIPDSVTIDCSESEIVVKGKFGTLQRSIPQTISVIQVDGRLNVNLNENDKKIKALHGLYRTLINNMVIGVSEQFIITLNLKGVGYRAAVQEKDIILSLGYSHPVKIEIPSNISVEVLQNTTVNLKSCDKESLGLFAANIRSWRKPEPYKGKGILYKNEKVLRKAGKSGK